MSEPRVAAMLLTADRPEMTARAIGSFRRQTYQNAFLYILDNGKTPIVEALPDGFPEMRIVYHRSERAGRMIGGLRNYANSWACEDGAEVLIHFDSDDTSHPLRIEEQVTLLQSSGADAVGYRDMLFLKEARCPVCFDHETCACGRGEAWLYRNNDPQYCLGTSLCYWRKTWEARPFNPKLPERRGATGEEFYWLQELKRESVTSLFRWAGPTGSSFDDLQPRMVASIHGSNTQDYRGIEKHPNNWTRVPEWDSYCRKAMEL